MFFDNGFAIPAIAGIERGRAHESEPFADEATV
jgi:hypothetical protein